MKKILSLAIGFFLTFAAFAQNNDYLVINWDTIYDQCGYIDQSGQMAIAHGKYSFCMTDTFRTFAVVYKGNEGWIGIDRQENTIFTIMQYDNGPDFPSENMFRITKGQKIGFANLEGEVVVPPKYDAAYPFQEGLAAFCVGCRNERMGEVSMWKDGQWGFLDKKGKVVIEPIFDKVNIGFKSGKIKVKKNNVIFEINKTGERVQEKVAEPKKN